MQVDTDGLLRAAEHRGDLFVAESLVAGEHEDLRLTVGQLGQGFGQRLLQLGGTQCVIGTVRWGNGLGGEWAGPLDLSPWTASSMALRTVVR
jgi:hypothetical protein